MFELDQQWHRLAIQEFLRQHRLLTTNTFAARLKDRIGREIHYRFVEYPDESEVEFSRFAPVEALFNALAGGWSLDPEWLANDDGRYLGDDGEPIPAESKPTIAAIEHLSTYGLFLIGEEFDSLGDLPDEGLSNQGFSREQVQQHRAACLLFGQQAAIYARDLLLVTRPSADEMAQAARAASARKAADARHAADPKAPAKRFVYECWKTWQAKPGRYASAAAFARDMLDKQPILESQPVIERWVRYWSKEDK